MNRTDISFKECQKDPIFLLQSIEYSVTCLPDWIESDGESYWYLPEYLPEWIDLSIKRQLENILDSEDPTVFTDELQLMEILCNPESFGGDGIYCLKQYLVHSVWHSRFEAEKFAKSTLYNFPFGYRVYCLSAKGELAKIICTHDRKLLAC